MAVAPYPYARWPRLALGALRGGRAWRTRLTPPEGERARQPANSALGAEVAIAPGAFLDRGRDEALALLSTRDVALCWTLEGRPARTPLVLALPRELAAELAARTLGGDGTDVHPPDAPLDDLSAGALAYLAARLSSEAGSAMRLCTVHTDATGAHSWLPEGGLLILPLTLTLAGRSWSLRTLMPPMPADPPDPAKGSVPALPPDLTLQLCAHAATVQLTRAELTTLAAGDALIPERCRLRRADDGFHGEVQLHAAGSTRTTFHCRGGGSELRIEHIEHHGGEPTMTEGKVVREDDGGQRASELAGDAPVELCLELARFTVTLDELARLAPGDALSTGKPIGQRVALRAGKVLVAEGELVDVDGEVGVRLTRVSSNQKLDASASGAD